MTKREVALETARRLQKVNVSLDDLVVFLEYCEENASVLEEQDVLFSKEYSIEKKIYNLLEYLEVPKNIRGYKYLKEAIKIVYENYNSNILMKRDVYYKIACKFSDGINNVERIIRHAIEVTWRNEQEENRRQVFKECLFRKNKPTNTEFIMGAVEFLKMKSI